MSHHQRGALSPHSPVCSPSLLYMCACFCVIICLFSCVHVVQRHSLRLFLSCHNAAFGPKHVKCSESDPCEVRMCRCVLAQYSNNLFSLQLPHVENALKSLKYRTLMIEMMNFTSKSWYLHGLTHVTNSPQRRSF